MEALYLLCSIVSTVIHSLVLSLLLPLQTFLRRRVTARSTSYAPHHGSESISLYEGTVWHERRRPVHHSFRYNVRYALIDLDHAPHVPPNHLSAGEARTITTTTGPIFLLTIPPSVGYEQNPLSLYYCYDVEGTSLHLKKCIAEVTNTPWGERVSFIFNPHEDVVAKPLHVSPFMDMHGNWTIKTDSPGDSLFVGISVRHPVLGDYFTATLKAKKLSPSPVSDHAFFFWLMPHKVAVWIYWHALKLWWKNVSFIQHPRYTIPDYRHEAILRDAKLHSCPAMAPSDGDYPKQRKRDNANGDRCFTWTNASWPWS